MSCWKPPGFQFSSTFKIIIIKRKRRGLKSGGCIWTGTGLIEWRINWIWTSEHTWWKEKKRNWNLCARLFWRSFCSTGVTLRNLLLNSDLTQIFVASVGCALITYVLSHGYGEQFVPFHSRISCVWRPDVCSFHLWLNNSSSFHFLVYHFTKTQTH